MVDQFSWLVFDALVVHWAIIMTLTVRVIMRRRPVGVSLAWIALIVSVPFLGAGIYLVIGENRISALYGRRAAAMRGRYAAWLHELGTGGYPQMKQPDAGSVEWLAQTVIGFPVLGGNRMELLRDYEATFRHMIADIEQARHSCHLEFYIWHPGGWVDSVAEALMDAAARGVECRVMVDAVGSKPMLRHPQWQALQRAGVAVAVALPTGLISMFVSRADLRNHRKVVVIDGAVAYTGSQNMVDPRYFKQDAGVGQWVDAMTRIEGPAATALAVSFMSDWEVVTGEHLTVPAVTPPFPEGPAIQLAPSGPGPDPLAILKLLLGVVYRARRELVITTPYFVPDDSLLTALVSAAQRGVSVTVVVPARNDSWLVDHASRSFFDDLLRAGVSIATFEGGLLHTKSITVDGELCVFGSLNLDMRSLWLNFEMSLLVYDREFTARLRVMQDAYLARAPYLDRESWLKRPLRRKFLENTVRLTAPLL